MLSIQLTLLFPFLLVPLALATEVTVTVSATASHAVPTTLWGATLDEINSIDGGLYAELLQNRAFQQVTPGTSDALKAWHSIGGTTINVIKESVPVSANLQNALQVTFPSGKILPVGIGNEGYTNGIKISTADLYTVSFWYRFPTASSFSGTANVGFQTAGGLSLGSVNVAINGAQTTWRQITTSFRPVQSPLDNNNWFAVTLNGSASSGQVINFAMFSVQPPTFRSRTNGVRADIANAMVSLTTRFIRYPGAENLGNGNDAQRWRWSNTINALVNRPGHVTSTGYISTDGFGLFEFLQFCEDIGALPIMTIYAGLTKDGSVVPESELLPIIQEAIDQINFAIAPASNPQGALRSNMGHQLAFNLQFVEVGANEENTSQEYQDRWTNFVTILSQQFPQLRFISSSHVNTPPLVPNPTHWDVHLHQTEGWFAQNSLYFDSFQRNSTQYLVSEFQASEGLIAYPTMQSAADEAAFMTGLERNADIIFGAGHSPFLNNIALTTRSPSTISFDQSSVILSTSYLVQQLFATNTFGFYLPSTLPDPNGSIFWSITTNTQQVGQLRIKLVNIGGSAENVTFQFPHGYTFVSQRSLTGSPSASNSPSAPSALATSFLQLPNVSPTNTKLTFVAQPCSVSVFLLS